MKPRLLETCTSVDCYWNKGAISNKNPGPIGMHCLYFYIQMEPISTYTYEKLVYIFIFELFNFRRKKLQQEVKRGSR
jgi:hypothetical protein